MVETIPIVQATPIAVKETPVVAHLEGEGTTPVATHDQGSKPAAE